MDLYDYEGELLFCHGFCDLGSQPANELVQEILDFLSNNPNEVLLIDLQDESNGRSAEAAFITGKPSVHARFRFGIMADTCRIDTGRAESFALWFTYRQ